jgi:phosphatidate cytidylyltransferase
MPLSSLGQRIATTAVLVPLVLAALFLLPPRAWALVALAILSVAAYEWSKLVGFASYRSLAFVGGVVLIALVLLFLPATRFSTGWPDSVVFAACGIASAFWILVAPGWLAAQWRGRGWLGNALAGWVVLLGAWVAIVELQARSPWLVLAAMAVVWIADTAAYFTGRRFGRRKLAPSISPNKSWEGVYGGVIAVALYALLLMPFAAHAGYAGAHDIVAGFAFVLFVVMLCAVSVVGDLFESLLKRQAGVKDSGSLLPGHGGVLDRIDALLSAMPPAAVAAAMFLPKAV